MSEVATSRRVPWVALALSFLATGVGHVYCGRIVKGLALYFAWLLVPLCVTVAAFGAPSSAKLVLLVFVPTVLVLFVYAYAAIDAWRIAYRFGLDYVLRDYNRTAVYWLLIVVHMIYPIGLMMAVKGAVYEAFVIPASSMCPTILSGDRILVRKLLPRHHFPERGELVVFRNPEPTRAEAYVKRVVAVAGDRIVIDGEHVSINGKELVRDRMPEESLKVLGEQAPPGQVSYESNSGRRYLVAYRDEPSHQSGNGNCDLVVPDRHVFVLGDNRDASKDSRYFGSVHIGDIIGYVDYIYWPAHTWSRAGRP